MSQRLAPALLSGVAFWAAVGAAADPPAAVPSTAPTRSAMPVREELLRRWDLDGDGSISKSEADVARARMRRDRTQMQLGAGLDPLTGEQRGIEDGSRPEPTDDQPFPGPLPGPEPRPARHGPRGPAAAGPPLPGQAVPGSAPPTGPVLSGRASWLPPDTRPPATSGGVRAGAPAAVPGYGAGSWSDLNAGRRPITVVDEPAATVRGGFLPVPRSPGRTGALLIPGRSPVPAAGPAAPRPPLVRPAPVTAEEMGRY